MSILRALTDRAWTGEIFLVDAINTDADRIFGDELDDLARRFPNLHVTTVVGRYVTADDRVPAVEQDRRCVR